VGVEPLEHQLGVLAAAGGTLLLSLHAATITGQIIDAEGGFRRFTPVTQLHTPPTAEPTPPSVCARRAADRCSFCENYEEA